MSIKLMISRFSKAITPSALALGFVALSVLPATAQHNVNQGALYVAPGTTLYFGTGGLLQNDPTDTTINEGTIYIDALDANDLANAVLRYAAGTIRQVNPAANPDGTLTGGWGQNVTVPEAFPNFHTIFAPGASTAGAVAADNGSSVDTLTDGAVRRQGGRTFTLPLGDRDANDVVHRGLVSIDNVANFADIDAEYFWRDGTADFGNALNGSLTAVSPLEYWQVWGDDEAQVELHFETSSALFGLLGGNPPNTLTIAGWNGTEWVDLGASLQDANNDGVISVGDLSGEGTVKTNAPVPNLRAYRVITFATTPFEEQAVLGVAKEAVDISYDPAIANRAIMTFDFVMQNYGATTPITQLQLEDNLGERLMGLAQTISVLNVENVTETGFVAVTPNTAYTGVAPNINLLTGADTLAGGQKAKIRLEVAVTFNSAEATQFANFAIGTGTTPNGTDVTDTSTGGDNPDPNGDGNPDEDDTTDVTSEYPTNFIKVTKSALVQTVEIGQPIVFLITAENLQSYDITADIVDFLPAGFNYEEGTAIIAKPVNSAPVALEPVVDGTKLIWEDITFAGGESAQIQLIVIPGVGVTSGEFVNLACAQAGTTGVERCVSNNATAPFTVKASAIFECSTVIGRVFQDENGDGYPDRGEGGVPGIRLGSPAGFFVYPDSNGLFSIPCADVPDSDYGTNYTLKLDESTLPLGYTVTTENPRSVRLTRGKTTEMNFGVTRQCRIEINLTQNAFVPGEARLHAQWQPYLTDMIETLANRNNNDCTLTTRLTTYNQDNRDLDNDRANAVSAYLTQLWENIGGRSLDTTVEIRTLAGQQPTLPSDFILVPHSMISALPTGSIQVDPAQLNPGTGPGRVDVPAGYLVFRTPANNLILLPSMSAPGYRNPNPNFGTIAVPEGSRIIPTSNEQLKGYKVIELPDGRWFAVLN